MKKIMLLTFLFVVVSSGAAHAVLKIVTTTTDLAALVKAVGQDQVDVFAIAKGTQDPHHVEAKPSFMVKMKNADLVIEQGLELETAWIVPLIQGSRNPRLNASEGVLELAPALEPLEVQTGPVSRADGDVHPAGNPHFQLDPIRLGKAAVLIAARLSSLDPAQKEFFTKNAANFQKHLEGRTKEWQGRIQKAQVREVVTYHKTFTYFCSRFAIQCQTHLEPKPGIPPTASHLLSVIETMKKNKIRVVLIENVFDDAVMGKLRQSIPDVVVERVPISVEGEAGITTSEQLIERLIQVLEKGKP